MEGMATQTPLEFRNVAAAWPWHPAIRTARRDTKTFSHEEHEVYTKGHEGIVKADYSSGPECGPARVAQGYSELDFTSWPFV